MGGYVSILLSTYCVICYFYCLTRFIYCIFSLSTVECVLSLVTKYLHLNSRSGVPILKTGSQNNSHGRDSLSLTRRCTVNYSITQLCLKSQGNLVIQSAFLFGLWKKQVNVSGNVWSFFWGKKWPSWVGVHKVRFSCTLKVLLYHYNGHLPVTKTSFGSKEFCYGHFWDRTKIQSWIFQSIKWVTVREIKKSVLLTLLAAI